MSLMIRMAGISFSCALCSALMGIDSCQTPDDSELCDGIDNDGDGLIDEDFDADSDRYFSTACNGGDCNDQNPAINPGAHEAADQADNDCDGRVDEAQSIYTLRFVNTYTGAAQSGVFAWLGEAGKEAFAWSDANGEVKFELESPVHTWSYANTYTTQTSSYSREYRRVTTRQNDTIVSGTTFNILDTSVAPLATLSGNVSNVDTSLLDSVVDVSNTSGLFEAPATSSSIAYEMASREQLHKHLLAAQYAPYVDSITGETLLHSLPSRFGMVLNPVYPQNIALDRAFDRAVTYSTTNLNPSMTLASPDLNLYLSSGSSQYFVDDLRELNGSSVVQTRLPSLTGPLAGARPEVDVLLQDGNGYGQGGELVWNGTSSSLTFDLKSLHTVTQSAPLAYLTLPGTAVDLQGSAGQDVDRVIFFEQDRDVNNSALRYQHNWSVTQYDAAQPVVFPVFPKQTFSWPGDDSSLRSLDLLVTSNTVNYGFKDGAPYYYTAAPNDVDTSLYSNGARPKVDAELRQQLLKRELSLLNP